MKAHAARESIDTQNRVVYNSHRIRKKERKGTDERITGDEGKTQMDFGVDFMGDGACSFVYFDFSLL